MTVSSGAIGSYKQISASANVDNDQGALKGIFVSAASATPTITVYESATTTTGTKMVDTFTPTAAQWYSFGDMSYAQGLYVVISGTVSCTVVYA